MFLTILKMGEPQDFNEIDLRLLLCPWRSWKIKDGWLSKEISLLFFYLWRTFIFHDLGKDSSHLKPFSLSWPCSPISEKVKHISLACLGAEILNFEVQKSKVFERKKFVSKLQTWISQLPDQLKSINLPFWKWEIIPFKMEMISGCCIAPESCQN